MSRVTPASNSPTSWRRSKGNRMGTKWKTGLLEVSPGAYAVVFLTPTSTLALEVVRR